jgi:hypothetical protein
MTVASPRAPPALLDLGPDELGRLGRERLGQPVDLVTDRLGVGDQPIDRHAGDDGREQRQQNIEGHAGGQQGDLVGLDLLEGPLGDVLPALGRDLLGGIGPPTAVIAGNRPRVGLVAGRGAAAGGRAEPLRAVRPAGPGPPAVAGPGPAGGLAPHHHGGGQHADTQCGPGHPPGQPRPLPRFARHLGHPGPPSSSCLDPRLPPLGLTEPGRLGARRHPADSGPTTS